LSLAETILTNAYKCALSRENDAVELYCKCYGVSTQLLQKRTTKQLVRKRK